MASKHEHPELPKPCSHEIAYCEKCDVCFCKKCGKEWMAKTFNDIKKELDKYFPPLPKPDPWSIR